VLAAEAVTKDPLSVKHAHGIAGTEAEAQQRPVAELEQAVSTWPLDPTGKAARVLAVVAASKSPFVVKVARGTYADAAAAGVSAVVISVPA
jgi:hypothetical protein